VFCSNCGKQLPDMTNFCSSCGTRLTQKNNIDNTSSKETLTIIKIIICSIIITVIVGMAGTIISSLGNLKTSNRSTKTAQGNMASNFTGTWIGTEADMGTSIIFVFNNNGTVQSESFGITNRGTFTVQGSNVKINMTEGFTGILFQNGQTVNYRYKFIGKDRLELSFSVFGITTKYNLTRRNTTSLNGLSNERTSANTSSSVQSTTTHTSGTTTKSSQTTAQSVPENSSVKPREITAGSRASRDPATHLCHGCGTTRCFLFQADYEEAVQKYDAQYRGLPRGLVMPNGRTVGDYVDADQFINQGR